MDGPRSGPKYQVIGYFAYPRGLFVWVVLLIAWLALAPDHPSHGEWWAAGVAVVFWAAPFWWVPHGSDVTYAGHGWSIPLSDSFFVVLTAILLATALRLVQRRARRLLPARTMAPPRPDGPSL